MAFVYHLFVIPIESIEEYDFYVTGARTARRIIRCLDFFSLKLDAEARGYEMQVKIMRPRIIRDYNIMQII